MTGGPNKAWAVLWHSHNAIDGAVEHLVCEAGVPVLFSTRARARAYVSERYGYIKNRPDLRAPPHGWRMPRAVRAIVYMDMFRKADGGK